MEISDEDALELKINQGDLLEIKSRRGTVVAEARIFDILKGLLFIPFHYGYWDTDDDEHKRAANELTITSWDPISKHPHFKFAVVKISILKQE